MKEPSVTLCSFLLGSWEPATHLSPALAVMSAGWREKWRAATNVPSLSLSLTSPPSFFFLSSPTSTRKICLLYLYRQPSESSHAIDFLHLATGWHPDREEGEQNRGGGGDGERQAECGIPRSDHYEKHVKRGRETEALTWASPHREKWWSGERWKKGNRQKWRKKNVKTNNNKGRRAPVKKGWKDCECRKSL